MGDPENSFVVVVLKVGDEKNVACRMFVGEIVSHPTQTHGTADAIIKVRGKVLAFLDDGDMTAGSKEDRHFRLGHEDLFILEQGDDKELWEEISFVLTRNIPSAADSCFPHIKDHGEHHPPHAGDPEVHAPPHPFARSESLVSSPEFAADPRD